MKKLLVIANLYHASPRIPAITENMVKLGWDVTIVTVPLGENQNLNLGFSDGFSEQVKVIEVPYSGDVLDYLRRFLQKIGFSSKDSFTEQIKERLGVKQKKSFVDKMLWIYQEIFAFPDAERLWKKPAVDFVLGLTTHEHFDVMLSSSPYPTSHVIASAVNSKVGIPWVADFRDTWTQNPVYPFTFIRRFFESRYEKRVLKNAEFMTTVSDSYAEVLRSFRKSVV